MATFFLQLELLFQHSFWCLFFSQLFFILCDGERESVYIVLIFFILSKLPLGNADGRKQMGKNGKRSCLPLVAKAAMGDQRYYSSECWLIQKANCQEELFLSCPACGFPGGNLLVPGMAHP